MRFAALFALLFLLPVFVYAVGLVNINTADAVLLDTLPGIGPSKAAAIINYRTINGPFTSTADIQKVKGIGPSTFANLRALITVGETLAVQPTMTSISSNKVQTIEPQAVKKVDTIISTNQEDQTHDEAVSAPTVAPETVAAVGAVPTKSAGILSSPWIFGLLGVILIAGSVFIFL